MIWAHALILFCLWRVHIAAWAPLFRDDDQDGIRMRQRVKSGPLPTGAFVPRD